MSDRERVEALAKVLHERFAADHLPHWDELDDAEKAESIYADMARAVLDSPAMGDLLAEAKADALSEAADRVQKFRDWYPVSIFPSLDEALADDYEPTREQIAAECYRHAYGELVPRNLRTWAEQRFDA